MKNRKFDKRKKGSFQNENDDFLKPKRRPIKKKPKSKKYLYDSVEEELEDLEDFYKDSDLESYYQDDDELI